jgi:hypothetical protein
MAQQEMPSFIPNVTFIQVFSVTELVQHVNDTFPKNPTPVYVYAFSNQEWALTLQSITSPES